MPRTSTSRTGRRSRKSGTARSKSTRRGARGRSSRSDAGRKGGNATLRARGPEFYAEIGRKGGKKSGSRRRASAARMKGGSARRGRKRG